jgi:hypothetical protein
MLASTRGSYGERQGEAGTGSSYGPSSAPAKSAPVLDRRPGCRRRTRRVVHEGPNAVGFVALS